MALLMPVWATAQLSVPTSVLGNGSMPTSNAQWAIKSTLAQPLIGPVEGANNQQLIGFWYQPKALLTRVEQVGLDGDAHDALLGQNFPNPSDTHTTIPFSVPHESFVELMLMKSNGQVVSKLAEGRFQSGQYQVEVAVGQMPPGTYLYQLYVDKRLAVSRKLVVGR